MRIVRDCSADANHDGIDQGPQTMEVGKAGLAIDVMRVAGGGGDAGIDRLAALPDHHEVVDYPLPQRAENVLPRLGQGTIPPAKRFRYARPRAFGAVFNTHRVLPCPV